jgi:O-methyltransferase involved in polyketide biosynthesis
VIWEGVTNYLTSVAVDATFRALRSLAERSRIAFTYVEKRVLRSSADYIGTETLNDLLRDVGEEWTFGFDPPELNAYLTERGFQLIEDLGADDYRARYLGPGKWNARGYSFYHAALAETSPTL